MIDWNRVDELRDEVGVDDFDEVVALFLSEVEDRLSGFDPAAAAPIIEEDMHFLKGSALNLGFQDLATFCGKAEALAAGGEIINGIEQVTQIYERSKADFLTTLDRHAAA